MELGKHADNDKERLAERCSMITVHEYGHAYQSAILGPFFIIPGIWSILWGRMKRYEHLRQDGVPYAFCWTESWANSLGERVITDLGTDILHGRKLHFEVRVRAGPFCMECTVKNSMENRTCCKICSTSCHLLAEKQGIIIFSNYLKWLYSDRRPSDR